MLRRNRIAKHDWGRFEDRLTPAISLLRAFVSGSFFSPLLRSVTVFRSTKEGAPSTHSQNIRLFP